MMRIVFFLVIAISFSSCKLKLKLFKKNTNEYSTSTGWTYNDRGWGGFTKAVSEGQTIGPNLVPIEGGTFVMGLVEEDVMYDYNNLPKRVTVNSFLMDETEVTNLHYREYTFWVRQVIGNDYPHMIDVVRPDTLVWRDELTYNEPMIENYFNYPAYNEYPVVGVSWEQATDYAVWRTDRVNEMLLRRRGIIEFDNDQSASSNFNTRTYLLGKYDVPDGKRALENLAGEKGSTRRVRRTDGIVLPDYRLPTEAEWEYAALAMEGNLIEGTELSREKRLYPWDGTSVRAQRGIDKGKILANMKRGRGDNMGVGGNLNDNAAYTGNVYSGLPNDFGLFNMAGNVSEWVADVYRPLSSLDVDDLDSYRGNIFTRKVQDENGDYQVDSLGRLVTREETRKDNPNRRNYRDGDVRGYRDGDVMSSATYGYGVTTLISDRARVYKGAGWDDRAYFMAPGTRRFLQQDQTSSLIGFRCAMDMLNPPVGNVIRGKASKKQMRRVKKNRANRKISIFRNAESKKVKAPKKVKKAQKKKNKQPEPQQDP